MKKHRVLVLGWNRESVSTDQIRNFSPSLKLFNMKAPYGKLLLVLFYPLFWIWIFMKLVKASPKVIHACDLDTILPCYVYKTIFRRKLVFDVCDRFAMSYAHVFSKPGSIRNGLLYSFVNGLEEFFAERADVLINVSHELEKTFKRRPKRCAVIMNCAEDRHVDLLPLSSKRGSKRNLFRIAYVGLIRASRGINAVISALEGLNDVEFVIAGRVLDKDVLFNISKSPHVRYEGLLAPEDALLLEAQSDVSIVLYDLNEPINRFSMGNKLFEAMMMGIPVITNVAHNLVNEVGCAEIVDYGNVNQIRNAIIRLRDNKDLLIKLGSNARRGFVQKYNWQRMEDQLFLIYQKLLEQ